MRIPDEDPCIELKYKVTLLKANVILLFIEQLMIII